MCTKKYSVIYADPPWNQKGGRPLEGYVVVDGKQSFKPIGNNSLNLPYETMSVQEIKNLPIKSIAEKDAHLYLWVTNKYLPRAIEVIESWGFKYSTTLVWCKKPLGGGLGGTFRVATEFLIFATRGSLKAKKTISKTWFEVKRPYVGGYPVHSKKPEFFRELIESVSTGDKLELFAREEKEGWDVWGNEVPNSINLHDGKA